MEASQYPFPTVVSGGGEWFESVRRALRWNSRGSTQKAWNGDQSNEEETEFDIDFDSPATGTDSGIGASEDGESCGTGSASPMRRQLSLLNM